MWTLRCERTISGTKHSKRLGEIEGRLNVALNKRLMAERIVATKFKRSSKAIKLVENTWRPILSKIHHLPKNWVTNLAINAEITKSVTRGFSGYGPAGNP
jgi:hypothetical protein